MWFVCSLRILREVFHFGLCTDQHKPKGATGRTPTGCPLAWCSSSTSSSSSTTNSSIPRSNRHCLRKQKLSSKIGLPSNKQCKNVNRIREWSLPGFASVLLLLTKHGGLVARWTKNKKKRGQWGLHYVRKIVSYDSGTTHTHTHTKETICGDEFKRKCEPKTSHSLGSQFPWSWAKAQQSANSS